jgi:multifunctional beta-oxidation protein
LLLTAKQKAGILGITRALAREGAQHNIYVNAIAPNAGTAMTRTILPEEVVQALKPEQVSPLVVALCSNSVPTSPSGQLYEAGSGWFGQTRWQRSAGVKFDDKSQLTAEAVGEKLKEITRFDIKTADYPQTPLDGLRNIAGLASPSINVS